VGSDKQKLQLVIYYYLFIFGENSVQAQLGYVFGLSLAGLDNTHS